MALSFPSNPSLNQTYQSGSSATYTWNGTYWQTSAPTTQMVQSASFAAVASYVNPLSQTVNITGSLNIQGQLLVNGNPVGARRRTVTDIANRGWGNGVVVADGKLFVCGASSGNANTLGALSSASFATSIYGIEGMHEIEFLNETGSIVDYALNSGQHAYVLFSNGNLYYWGANDYGQAGNGTTTDVYVPILSATNVTKIFHHPSQGQREKDYQHFFHQKSDGKVYGCGYNNFGQLGLGNTTATISTWTEVTGIGTNPMGVYPLGSYSGITVAQKSDGTIIVTGYNGFGALGIGNTTNQSSFVTAAQWKLDNTNGVIRHISYGCGDNASNELSNLIMVLDDGTKTTIRTSGNCTYGTLGNGVVSNFNITVTAAPTGIFNGPQSGSNRIKDMRRTGDGRGSIYVLTEASTLYAWGYNGSGQLGVGNTTNSGTVTAVASGVNKMFGGDRGWASGCYITQSPILEFVTGSYHTYLIAGDNSTGYIADGSTTQRNSFTRMRFPVDFRMQRVGAFHTSTYGASYIAQDQNNKLWVWGFNESNSIYARAATGLLVPFENTPQALYY